MKTLVKECFRTIKKNFRKFLSILLVVLLGVGFFAGIRATSPDMKDTLDAWAKEVNFHDFNLMSTWGITEDDIQKLKDSGYNVEATYSIDAIVKEDLEEVVKIMAYNEDFKIDQITLLEGSLPKNNKECVIEKNQYTEFHKIGDKITVETDSLKETELTIVGFVKSPEYISLERGTTNLLTGKISYFMLVPYDNFTLDYWTNLKIALNTNEYIFSDNYENLIDTNKKELEDITEKLALDRYHEALNEIEEALEELKNEENKFHKEIASNTKKIKDSYTEIENNKKLLDQNKQLALEEFALKEKTINDNLAILNTQLASFGDVQNDTVTALKNEIMTLEGYLNTLYSEREKTLNEINNHYEALEEGLKEVKKNEQKLNSEKTKALKKFDEAFAKIEKNKEELEIPEWYILTRNENIGYYSYSQDTERIANIAEVFPLVFFVVAVFICLTSMTRMVEEERNSLGTLKSLGFTSSQIMFKYLLYAFLATLLGSVIGILIGMNVLPKLVFKMYALVYSLDELKLNFSVEYALIGTLIAVFCTMIATYIVTRKCLKEVPAELMRPKSPKPGKKVLLEKIPFIWNHLSFSQKVTIRNVFRYKKRFLMTIIGIMGSTSLIIAGYGLKDCIVGMVPNQFQKVYDYELEITFKDDLTLKEKQETIEKLKEFKEIKDQVPIYKESVELTNYETNQDIQLVVPMDDISGFINLNDRLTKEKYDLKDEVIITEKIANLLHIEENDVLKISGTKDYKTKVGHITENYISHYIYMPKEVYADDYFNTILVKTADMTLNEEKELSNKITEIETIASLTWTSSTRNIFDDTMETFEFVVGVLIVSSGMLTFIVLYNLASVNISERKRELATIKVLGFTDYEVFSYINKETIILTLIGILCGAFFGKFLTVYIIRTCELDNFMFGTTISWQSYLLSVAIMILWTFIVSIITYFSLKKVDMIESLKSVE